MLPRQTCGVYTHTNKFTDVSGGKTGLTAIAEEGEVLNAILNNPVSHEGVKKHYSMLIM